MSDHPVTPDLFDLYPWQRKIIEAALKGDQLIILNCPRRYGHSDRYEYLMRGVIADQNATPPT